MMRQLLWTLALAIPSLTAGPVFWTLAGDAKGVGRILVQFDPIAGTQQAPVPLGNGNASFAGGLVWDHFDTTVFPAAFYGPATDTSGQFFFVSWDSTGAGGSVSQDFSPILPPGILPKGTAEIENNGQQTLWVILSDAQGNSILTDWSANTGNFSTTSVQLTQGSYSGAAYNSDDGDIYVIKNDGQGNSSLLRVNLTTSVITPMPIVLGTGFTGGLTYTGGQFYSIRNAGGSSTVYRFALNDSSPTQIYTLGQGFEYASLATTPTAGPAAGGSAVPEPGTILLSGLGLVAAMAYRARK